MADERLPEEAPREEDPEHGDGDLDTSAEAPAALAVTLDLIPVTSADADDRDEDSGPDPRSVVLATGQCAEPPPILLLTPATTGTGSAAQPNVTEQAGKEHRGLPERLREAAISYTADPAATRIVPADGPVGEASDVITGWITGLAEKPARGLAAGAGVPEALATPATGILAICVTSPVTEPVEDASKAIDIAGVIIGLVIQSHMIVTAFGQPLLHSMVSGLIKNALTALWPAAETREETRPANPASQASSSPDTDRQPPSEFPEEGRPPGTYWRRPCETTHPSRRSLWQSRHPPMPVRLPGVTQPARPGTPSRRRTTSGDSQGQAG